MEAKKILFVSLYGDICDVAWQVVKEGHQAKYYIHEPSERESGDGFIPKVEDWEKEVEWADLIVFDNVEGLGTKAKKLREQGKLVVGGTPYTDKLEDDRAFGQEELKKAGVNIIPHWDFTSFADAITFVKENPSAYVIKPSGHAQANKSLLFVGEEEDGKDVVQVLEDYQRAWAKKITYFQLQKKVAGVEIAVGAFFNGKQFIMPLNVNFEHKKLFPGELGPSTGEMGTLAYWSGENKIFNHTLKKMEPMLAQEGYVGYVDINCIVNSKGIYPLEFTARFGYPTISIQQEGMSSPLGEFLYELAKGTDYKLKVKSGFQLGVILCVPPFPFNDRKTFEVKSKDSVIVFKKPTEGVHIIDVKLVNNEWLVTGTLGTVMIVSGTAPTVKQAQQQVYNRIKNIIIPHMYYRTDIGDRWMEDADRLHTWGYLREL